MKTLLTGAAGFLGRVVLEKILGKGTCEIRVLVRSEEGVNKVKEIIGPLNKDRVEIFIGDFSSPKYAAYALAGVERLIHVAAALKGTSSCIFGNNAVGSRVILETILRLGVCKDILLVSSLGVYGLNSLNKNDKVDEKSPIDPQPERRDIYTYSKIWQEKIFQNYQYKNHEKNFNLCIVRPGPIYGPGGNVLPARLGLNVPFLFLNFGNNNLVPLTYVDNCAEAISLLVEKVIMGTEIFNVIDPDVPTATQYLRKYRQHVENFRYVTIPYPIQILLSRANERYSERSLGQIPSVLSVYKTENMWKRILYDNSKLLREGWKPTVSTKDGLDITFKSLKYIRV